jgi:hypothetical protein
MPYKIHREHREPIQGTHLIPETEPLFTVETRKDAEEALRGLVEQGVTDVYAVGFGWPPKEPLAPLGDR